jgi:hypothetical protein
MTRYVITYTGRAEVIVEANSAEAAEDKFYEDSLSELSDWDIEEVTELVDVP